MKSLNQLDTPVAKALEEQRVNRLAHFDVPGHKGGRMNPALNEYFGAKLMSLDVNSMKPLDNLAHPVSVIKDAQALAAKAFGADNAFFIVNGTTAAVQTMIFASIQAGQKIILPRNVHRSAINALVVNGAVPVYVNPQVNPELGIPLGMRLADVEAAISANPDAKAVFVNNPTYYGICSDLRSIVALAHAHNMLVLVDEAHGTHFYFSDKLPVSAMAAGADMAACSVHKTGGSLTQSSADYARGEVNDLGGYHAFGPELVNGDSVCAFDTTKLSVHTREIGLAGIEVYDLLRDDYGIQIEFGDVGNILCILSSGDRPLDIERLISALSEIRRLHAKSPAGLFDHEYVEPQVEMSPQAAFYAQKRPVPIAKSEGYVAAEFVMCYPPGIPILAPGERITREVLDYVLYAKSKGCFMTGPADMKINRINVVR